LFRQNWKNARLNFQLLIDISAFGKPENPLSIHVESHAIAALTEPCDSEIRIDATSSASSRVPSSNVSSPVA
jgi:hypothetical protein